MHQAKTTCPYCGVGCGVNATVADNGKLSAVEGDLEHPANYGRLCVKGSALHETLGDQGRLTRPRVDGEEVSWDQALSATADRLTRLRNEHGHHCVAAYLSGQLLTEDYYVANKLFKGFWARRIWIPIRGCAWLRRWQDTSAPSVPMRCPATMKIWKRPNWSCW